MTRKTDTKKFHGELDAHMTQVFGRDIGVINGATSHGNKNKAELKIEEAQKELQKLEQQKEAVQREIKLYSDSLNKTVATKKSISEISVRSNKFNKDEVVLSVVDWERTKNRALKYSDPKLKDEIRQKNAEIEDLRNQIPKKKPLEEQMADARKNAQERERIRKLEDLEVRVKQMPPEMREKYLSEPPKQKQVQELSL
jgi:Rad3-related DNA helicase